MPSVITHQLIAEDALPLLPPSVQTAVRFAPDYYFLGAQGPDLLFYYRFFSRKEFNFGRLLHRKHAKETFAYFAECLRSERFRGEARDQVLAYLYGYLAHYCTDVAFHPFVYAFLQERPENGFLHQQIESDWDTYFLAQKRGKSAERYRFPFSARKIAREGVLAELYAGLAERLSRRPVSKRKMRKAIKWFSRYLKFFHGRCYRRRRNIARAEKLMHLKPRLSALFPREKADERFLSGDDFGRLSGGNGENAEELYERAVKETVELARLFNLSVQWRRPLDKSLFHRSLLTGKSQP